MRAVIVGAGMGGLMTALALRQSSIFASVDVYEQTKVPSTAGAEITAKTERDPSQVFNDLTQKLGVPFYERMDAPATRAQKELLKTSPPNRSI